MEEFTIYTIYSYVVDLQIVKVPSGKHSSDYLHFQVKWGAWSALPFLPLVEHQFPFASSVCSARKLAKIMCSGSLCTDPDRYVYVWVCGRCAF